MKKHIYIIFAAVAVLFAACQQKEFRTVFPEETPQVSGELLTSEVLYGTDSVTVRVNVTAKQTPLSTLTLMVTVGEQENTKQVAKEVVRTKDYEYSATHTYFVPFGSGMDDGAPVKVYLTAENVEGVQNTIIVEGCIGHRPAINTLYIMPPTVQYGLIGKGTEMTKQGNTFVAYDLGYPKKVEFLLAVHGNKFGRIDWTQPVFGVVDNDITLITEEMFENGLASSIQINNDDYSTIDTIIFDATTLTLTYGGKIVTPVTTLNVNTDLLENPDYMSSGAAKEYRGAKIFFDPELEFDIVGVTDITKAYNLDYMELLDNGKVRFLGDKGQYYVSYKVDEDYIVVEPDYNLQAPEAMWMCGVGMGQPSANPKVTSGWGWDSPNQCFATRQVQPKVYQCTVYMNNSEDAEHAGWGTVNFKFFHAHKWDVGEEFGPNYTMSGLNIMGSQESSNNGNWWATSAPFEGIYRITLDMNNMTTTYEKIR